MDPISAVVTHFTRPRVLARARSAAVLGIDAYLVQVETDIANDLPTFVTVGLPQGAVKEGRERVFAALANSGYTCRVLTPRRRAVFSAAKAKPVAGPGI
jgi:Mg-chelatase subunit ChlI-like protein